MNRFLVQRGKEPDFEQRWRQRDSFLSQVPGFIEFHLLKGEATGEGTQYSSYVRWTDQVAFESWVSSDEFKKAHKSGDGQSIGMIGHPKLELFTSVLAR